MSGDDETLKILDVLLCAEIFNQNPNLDVNDLTPEHRIMFGLGSVSGIKRPITVNESSIRRVLQIQDPRGKVADNPVECTRSSDSGSGYRLSKLPQNGS